MIGYYFNLDNRKIFVEEGFPEPDQDTIDSLVRERESDLPIQDEFSEDDFSLKHTRVMNQLQREERQYKERYGKQGQQNREKRKNKSYRYHVNRPQKNSFWIETKTGDNRRLTERVGFSEMDYRQRRTRSALERRVKFGLGIGNEKIVKNALVQLRDMEGNPLSHYEKEFTTNGELSEIMDSEKKRINHIYLSNSKKTYAIHEHQKQKVIYFNENGKQLTPIEEVIRAIEHNISPFVKKHHLHVESDEYGSLEGINEELRKKHIKIDQELAIMGWNWNNYYERTGLEGELKKRKTKDIATINLRRKDGTQAGKIRAIYETNFNFRFMGHSDSSKYANTFQVLHLVYEGIPAEHANKIMQYDFITSYHTLNKSMKNKERQKRNKLRRLIYQI